MTLILDYDKFKKPTIFVHTNKPNPNSQPKCHVEPLLSQLWETSSAVAECQAGLLSPAGPQRLWIWALETSASEYPHLEVYRHQPSRLGCLALGERREGIVLHFGSRSSYLFQNTWVLTVLFFPPFFSQVA